MESSTESSFLTAADNAREFSGVCSVLEVVSRLRHPVTGCPWDLKQTHSSLRKYLLEEAYETVEAIDHLGIQDCSSLDGKEGKSYASFKEELGDVLLQVLLHSQIARDNGHFDFEAVCKTLSEKLIRRHPHVFGNVEANDSETVLKNWEAIKQQEKQVAQSGDAMGDVKPEPNSSVLASSILNGISLAQPALSRATKISQKAVAAGFEWPNPEALWACVMSEFEEFRAEIDQVTQNPDRLEDELGDILFATVNLARQFKIDPEVALTRASTKFTKRFQTMERLIDEQSDRIPLVQTENPEDPNPLQTLRKAAMANLDFETWDRLWEQAKTEHQENKNSG
jgi:MazG family protein